MSSHDDPSLSPHRPGASRDGADPSSDSGLRPAEHDDGSRANISLDAKREVVFAHLLDPGTYPDWLVGAKRIRAVDEDWPNPGSRFHHRVGFGPLKIDDHTTVVSVSTPDELVLRASIGPFGDALIRFTLEGSSPTIVHFDEAPDSGFLKFIGHTAGRWALRPTAWGRNRASLRRLNDLLVAEASATS